MNAARNIEMGPIPVRAALLVGGDPEIESQLRRILEPGLWALQHVSDNATALVMALGKNFVDKSFSFVLTTLASAPSTKSIDQAG